MISAIVCVDNNWGIGYNGELLVHIPEDMKFFKEKTTNNVVIMGRKTYDSLSVKPLPNRINIVVTSNADEMNRMDRDGVMFFTMNSIEVYLETLSPNSPINYCIIGGGQIYKKLLPYCSKIYITKVNHVYKNADTFFPNIDDMLEWEVELISKVKEYNGIEYQFFEYKKKEV